MSYYAVNTSNTLQHHGILGQRWGKRNGPPYPLSGGAHSQKEKKHGTKGYDGIMDVNDALYSGYKAKSPVIIFNGANKASIIDHKTLNNVQLGMNYLGAELAIRGSTLATLAGGVATASRMKSYSKSKSVQDDVVKTYRKEHPGSNLSRTEILDNYYGYKV